MGVDNDSLSEDLPLAKPFSKWFFPVEKFIEDDSDRPNINFFRDVLLVIIEYLWGKVPISPDSRCCQCNSAFFVLYCLANAKIDDFDDPLMKEDVRRFEIEVHHSHLLLPQVLHHKHQLLDD